MFKFMLPKLILQVEKWKWNKEYSVFVSNLGHFKNEKKQNVPVLIDKDGYVAIKTPVGLKKAHRLVMLTFRPIPNAESLTVDHLNHNKRDNSIYNLEWVTQAENLNRAAKDLLPVAVEPPVRIKPTTAIMIANKNRCFDNIDLAAEWLMKDQGMHFTTNFDKVERKIEQAIKNDKKYCNYVWKVKVS